MNLLEMFKSLTEKEKEEFTELIVDQINKKITQKSNFSEKVKTSTGYHFDSNKEEKLEYDIGNKKYVFDNNGLSIEEEGEQNERRKY